ncbi:MAG: tetratricopeptide repeat protein, partial [Deltaproteobacteria bacterium]|nr:tetratricopeptide repeat protein [Deltaproteobacteria bacterium]
MDKYEKMEEFKDLLGQARADGDREAEASALYGIGEIYLKESILDAAEDFFSQCARVCRESGQNEELAQVLIDLGNMAVEAKAFDKSEKLYLEAMEICKELTSPQVRARLLDRIGDLALAREDWDRALEVSLEGLKLCQGPGDNVGAIFFLEKIIPIYKAKGLADDVEASYRALVTAADKIGDRDRMALGLVGLADVYERTGKSREAIPHLEMAHDLYLRLGKENEAGLIREQVENLR